MIRGIAFAFIAVMLALAARSSFALAPNETTGCLYTWDEARAAVPGPPCRSSSSVDDIAAFLEAQRPWWCAYLQLSTCPASLQYTASGSGEGDFNGMHYWFGGPLDKDNDLQAAVLHWCPYGTGAGDDGICRCWYAGQTWSDATGTCRCPEGTTPLYGVNRCVHYVETDETQKALSCEAAPRFGNPIQPSTGTKRETVDLLLRVGGLPLAIIYDSTQHAPRSANTMGLDPELIGSEFGALWHGSFHRRLSWTMNRQGLRALRGDGRIVTFTKDANGAYTSDGDVTERLRSDNLGRMVIEDPVAQLLETYDDSGRLVQLTRLDGRAVRLLYSDAATPASTAPAPSYPVAVEDDSGRRLSFSYSLPSGSSAATDGRVTRITDAAGAAVTLTYDARSRLASIRWQDGSSRQFLYEHRLLPWALTGVVDERGRRASTFGWDNEGRAVSTTRGADAGGFSVSYQTPPSVEVLDTVDWSALTVKRVRRWIAPTGVAVRQPNGSTTNLSVGTLLGAPHVTSRSQPAGSGCGASSSSVGYDAQGNVAVRDDFNGNRSCLSHDARNLLLSRVDGLDTVAACASLTPDGARLPAGARKTTLRWHPEWQLPTRSAEPGRLTTWVYNGQPDPFAGNAPAACAPTSASLMGRYPIAVLCKTVVQATTDLSGEKGLSAALDNGTPARVGSYTYDASGRMLSATDTLGHATAFTYYAGSTVDVRTGDLASVTNAKAHTTRFTRYDAHGNLLQTVDANGVTTDLLYDVRQRMVRQTVAGIATVFTYEPSGQLSTVTWSDGSTLSYTYDDAHRLSAVTDGQGHRITYGLDANGEVVQESRLDPQGALADRVDLLRDALGRVQRMTGRE